MKFYGLAYHDVVSAETADSSGFRGALAAQYKVTPDLIHAHFEKLTKTVSNSPSTIDEPFPQERENNTWILTFDDGGVSAYERTADILEHFGWYGHFFVITDCIDKPGYLTKGQIRILRARGHVIGSHTCSHPYPMAKQSDEKQCNEWSASLAVLSDILGERVTSGAFPGGSYSNKAAAAASRAGVRFLFTLEPRSRPWLIEGCQVVGRYLIRHNTTPAKAAAFAAGKSVHCVTERLFWNVRKLPKLLGGRYYDRAKEAVFSRKKL